MSPFRRARWMDFPTEVEVHQTILSRKGDMVIASCSCGYREEIPFTCTPEEADAFRARLGTHDLNDQTPSSSFRSEGNPPPGVTFH